jgi:hypothetical protein
MSRMHVAHFACAKVDKSWHFANITYTQVTCSCMTRARGANPAHFVRAYESLRYIRQLLSIVGRLVPNLSIGVSG